MKTRKAMQALAMALMLTGTALAQTGDDQENNDEEFSARMQAAEERLAEAARRVAELSSERLGSMGDIRRYAFEFSDKPRLGVTIESDSKSSPVEGVSILGVTPGSAAADAGLRAGDMITSVNGESLSAGSSEAANKLLLDFMRGVEEGDRLAVEYLRDGKVGVVEVEPRVVTHDPFAWLPDAGHPHGEPGMMLAPKIVEKFRHAFGGLHGAWGDMELVSLSRDLGRYFGTESGLLVISAPKSGGIDLQDGDVIQSIDGREPTSVNHCMRILGSYQPGEKLVLNIMRDKKQRKIDIEVPDDRTSRLSPPPRPVAPARAPVAPPAAKAMPAERT